MNTGVSVACKLLQVCDAIFIASPRVLEVLCINDALGDICVNHTTPKHISLSLSLSLGRPEMRNGRRLAYARRRPSLRSGRRPAYYNMKRYTCQVPRISEQFIRKSGDD